MKKALTYIENIFNRAFTPRFNPLYHLGAICVFFMWILLATGVYLFIFYKIGSPHESVRIITEEQWGIGAFIRSVHRYSSDGLVAFCVLHLARELIKGRFRHWRWVPWVTGVVTLGVIWVTGIIGYWMVWDRRSQMIAEETSRLLDFIPVFGESLTMAFTTAELITNFFFFIALFLHLTLPVLLFIVIWIHVLRTSKPAITPPRRVYAVLMALVFALALIKPATSLEPADTTRMVTSIGIDWFYLFIYPVAKAFPVWASWALMASSTGLLLAVPWWLFPKKRAPVAEVVTEACTGCEQCHEDCPYTAISMLPRTDDLSFDHRAEVLPSKCASCGICYGSCDFSAVEFPRRPEEEVFGEIDRAAGAGKIVAFVCDCLSGAEALIDPSTNLFRDEPGSTAVRVPCIGMIHVYWLERALEKGAGGVFIWGCQEGDCHYRTGNQWLMERIKGQRKPVLRAAVERSRIAVLLSSKTGKDEALEALSMLRSLGPSRDEPVKAYEYE